MIRMKVSDMRVIGRNTAGVRLFDVADKEQIVSAALIEAEDDPAEDTDIIDATSPDEAIGATEAE
jgi:DNA gyrase subunit A